MKKPTQYEVEDLLEAAKEVETAVSLVVEPRGADRLLARLRAAINAVGGDECSECGVALLGSDLCSACYAEAEATDRAIDEDEARHG